MQRLMNDKTFASYSDRNSTIASIDGKSNEHGTPDDKRSMASRARGYQRRVTFYCKEKAE